MNKPAAYGSDSISNPMAYLGTGIAPAICIVTELLKIYACDIRQGLSCNKVFRISELSPRSEMVLKFYVTEKLFRKGITILYHPFYMLTKSFFYIILKPLKSFMSDDTCYIFILGTCCKILITPVHLDFYLPHNFLCIISIQPVSICCSTETGPDCHLVFLLL